MAYDKVREFRFLQDGGTHAYKAPIEFGSGSYPSTLEDHAVHQRCAFADS